MTARSGFCVPLADEPGFTAMIGNEERRDTHSDSSRHHSIDHRPRARSRGYTTSLSFVRRAALIRASAASCSREVR